MLDEGLSAIAAYCSLCGGFIKTELIRHYSAAVCELWLRMASMFHAYQEVLRLSYTANDSFWLHCCIGGNFTLCVDVFLDHSRRKVKWSHPVALMKAELVSEAIITLSAPSHSLKHASPTQSYSSFKGIVWIQSTFRPVVWGLQRRELSVGIRMK